MTRAPMHIAVLILIILSCTFAQEKPTPVSKPQPDLRALGVTAPDTLLKASSRESTAKPTQGLPKFDLPEYVITGAASIDLPEVEKQDATELPNTVDLANPLDALRDRSTVEYDAEGRKEMAIDAHQGQSGRVMASSGTYFNSKIGLWVNRVQSTYALHGDAAYGVSKAYIPFTNRSEGHVYVIGGMTLNGPSEWAGGYRLLGDLGYANEAYRLYGSQSPGTTRSMSRIRLSASFESPREELFNYGGQGGMLVTGIGDSSSTNTETQFHFGFGSNILVGLFPLDGKIDFSVASLSGSTSPALPYLDVSLVAPKHWFRDFFVQGSVHLFVTQGMLSQKFARVYPNVEVGYKVFENTVLSAAYLGRVQFNTLSSLIEMNPYLSATSTIRQSDIPLNLNLALETDWNAVWRTRFSARFQSVRDYPLLTEGGGGLVIALWGAPGHKGMWTTDYLGTTSVSSYQADIFAKFDANSYFTLSLEINSSKNSKTQWQVPYLPELRIGGGALLGVLRGLTVHPTVAYVGLRVPDLYELSKLKDYVVLGIRGEYAALRSLDVFLDIQNLTDSHYDEWNGYRALPFVMTVGISFRW